VPVVPATRALPRWSTLLVAALAIGAAVVLAASWRSGGSPTDVTFTIPAGTQIRIDAGEVVDVLPETIEVERGGTIVITNEDSATHQAGPFTVPANSSVRQRFDELGTFTSACRLHPSGELSITVT
jgi:plastocyanin